MAYSLLCHWPRNLWVLDHILGPFEITANPLFIQPIVGTLLESQQSEGSKAQGYPVLQRTNLSLNKRERKEGREEKKEKVFLFNHFKSVTLELERWLSS